MPDFDDLARAFLDRRRDGRLLRTRRIIEPIDPTRVRLDGAVLVQFCSNDYLGLAHHEAVIGALSGTTAGSGAAPLISGRSADHAAAERAIADWKGVADAVLLPSGYQANIAALQAAGAVLESAGRRPRFLLDKLAHASLIDAAQLVAGSARGGVRTFGHNDVDKLERLLADASLGTADVVVTESVFSMDGDEADLRGIVELKRRRPFTLVLDEAHATGVFGAGLASEQGVSGEVDVGIATLGKALGVAGGAVYGSSAVVGSVVNGGRAYLFSTAAPASLARAVVTAIGVARDDAPRRTRLARNIAALRDGLARRGIDHPAGRSPIVPIRLNEEAAALAASERLIGLGFLVIAVRPPTVPRGTSRLRVTVTSEHGIEQIARLVDALAEVVP